MKILSILLFTFFLSACDPAPINSARQDVACTNNSGVYLYTTSQSTVLCKDGTRQEWTDTTGPAVAEALKTYLDK